MNSEGDSLAACNSLPHLMCTRLPYSGKFSKGPIFGKGHLQRSNFREWPFLSEILVPEKTSASFSSIRMFSFNPSLHFCVSRFYGQRWHCHRQWIRKLGSIARHLKKRNRYIPVEVQQQQTGVK